MRKTSVIKVADDMSIVCNCWRYGLRCGAVIKMARLVAYTTKLLVHYKWDSLLWGYLRYLWVPERSWR